MPEQKKQTGSIVGGFIWMLIISVLLFWLPLLGPIVAGFVGGRKAGSVVKAILAALLPIILLAVLTVFVIPIFPFLGFLTGYLTLLVGFNVGLMLLGAIIGGAL